MYNGNPNLRGADQTVEYTPEIQEEIMKCMEDILYFAQSFCHIVTIDQGKVLIKLWDFQKKILKAFLLPPDKKKSIIFKSPRQSGKTTLAAIFIVHYILFNKDKNVAILANKESTALEILRRVKMIYENLPIWMQVGIKDAGWNAKTILLANGARIMAASTSSDTIRGQTFNLLYLDEFAFVPNNKAEDFMRSVYPTITSGKTSKVIISSTPKGMNHFFTMWSNSVKNRTTFYPISIKWRDVPGRDDEFKQNFIKDNGIQAWLQEFECKFLGSTSTLIDGDILENIDYKEPVDIKYTGLLEIYEHPRYNSVYILGVDSAEGVGGDDSVINVLRIDNEISLEQVAVYNNNLVDPYKFAEICIAISEYYNNAYMMIENNGVGAIVAERIWYTHECEYIINCDKRGIGIRSTNKSKLEANMLLKKYIENGWLQINNKKTIYQLSLYEEQTPGTFRALSGEHDDFVTSIIWALYFLITPFFEGKDISVKKVSNDIKLSISEDNIDEPPIVAIVDGGCNDFDDV